MCDVSISSQITDMVSQASKISTLRSHIAKDENCELVFEVMTYETDQIFEEIRLLKEVQQLRLLNYSANN